jgi:hypothetical protein
MTGRIFSARAAKRKEIAPINPHFHFVGSRPAREALNSNSQTLRKETA